VFARRAAPPDLHSHPRYFAMKPAGPLRRRRGPRRAAFALSLCVAVGAAAAEKVAVYGDALARSSAFIQELRRAGFEPVALDPGASLLRVPGFPRGTMPRETSTTVPAP
jgi:hypothetical protein